MGAQSEADLAGEMAGAHGRIWMTGGAPRANWVCTQPRTRLGLATYGRTPGGGGHAARGGGGSAMRGRRIVIGRMPFRVRGHQAIVIIEPLVVSQPHEAMIREQVYSIQYNQILNLKLNFRFDFCDLISSSEFIL